MRYNTIPSPYLPHMYLVFAETHPCPTSSYLNNITLVWLWWAFYSQVEENRLQLVTRSIQVLTTNCLSATRARKVLHSFFFFNLQGMYVGRVYHGTHVEVRGKPAGASFNPIHQAWQQALLLVWLLHSQRVADIHPPTQTTQLNRVCTCLTQPQKWFTEP